MSQPKWNPENASDKGCPIWGNGWHSLPGIRRKAPKIVETKKDKTEETKHKQTHHRSQEIKTA